MTKTIQRRQVLHEYPQRDIPYLEDLGKGATQYKVTAFLVGDNCVAQAKRLEKALLTPGAGTFVHPWDGALTVSVYGASNISYSNSELRYCSLDITFVEAGELGFPNRLVDGPTLARQLAGQAWIISRLRLYGLVQTNCGLQTGSGCSQRNAARHARHHFGCRNCSAFRFCR